jgi:putative ATP-binding cassette transporter
MSRGEVMQAASAFTIDQAAFNWLVNGRLLTASARRAASLLVALDGTAVVGDTDVTVMPGERVLIAGNSGSGKSTLVRAIAGIWPWGGGSVEIKRDAKLFLLPQKPYISLGTLRRAATYSDVVESKSNEEVAEASAAASIT